MFVTMSGHIKNNDQLADYVRKKLKKGYPDGELRNELLQQGYNKEEIERLIYNPPATEAGKQKENRQRLDNNPLWYFASIGLLITGIAFKSVSYFRESSLGTILLVAGIGGLIAKVILSIKNR